MSERADSSPFIVELLVFADKGYFCEVHVLVSCIDGFPVIFINILIIFLINFKLNCSVEAEVEAVIEF